MPLAYYGRVNFPANDYRTYITFVGAIVAVAIMGLAYANIRDARVRILVHITLVIAFGLLGMMLWWVIPPMPIHKP